MKIIFKKLMNEIFFIYFFFISDFFLIKTMTEVIYLGLI